MKKTTFLTITLSFLVVLPAMAQLGQVWTDFQSYSVDLQNYLSNNLSDTLKPLEIRTQGSLNSSKGNLNIPNPIAAGEQIQDDITLYSISDKFENNPAVRGTSASNEINRFLTRGSVESFLGRNGQNRTKTKLKDTQESLKNLIESNDEDDNDVTQFTSKLTSEFIKTNPLAEGIAALISVNQKTIRIQQEQTKIVAETFAQTVQTNQSLQYSNLNLANISQQMEELNRARRVDTSAEAARLLRTTSQMDLFGRPIEN